MGLGSSMVAPYRGGRLGNQVIHTYKAFWFACIHGIPLRNVALHENRSLYGTPLFSRLDKRFMSAKEFSKIHFNIEKNCGTKPTRQARQELFDLPMSDGDNVAIIHASLYPELPWERALFVSIFDNPEFRKKLSYEYREVLCGNTVGYTIRRTDTLSLGHWWTLTEIAIVTDLRRIVDQHRGLVRILVASDDVSYVRRLLEKYPDVGKHVYVVEEDEDTTIFLLSLCDCVICNGEHQCSSSWVNFKKSMFGSTFGQIAQILNRSYKYEGTELPPSCDFSLIDRGIELSGDVPDIIAESRNGDTVDYPEFID